MGALFSNIIVQLVLGCGRLGFAKLSDLEADRYYRMGELEPWIDENFVRSVWYNMGEQVNVKMIRDKFSG